jgi:hypothetical protein
LVVAEELVAVAVDYLVVQSSKQAVSCSHLDHGLDHHHRLLLRFLMVASPQDQNHRMMLELVLVVGCLVAVQSSMQVSSYLHLFHVHCHCHQE